MWALGIASLLTVLSRAVRAAIHIGALSRRRDDAAPSRLRVLPRPGAERSFARIMRVGSFSALRMLGMNLSRLFLVGIIAGLAPSRWRPSRSACGSASS